MAVPVTQLAQPASLASFADETIQDAATVIPVTAIPKGATSIRIDIPKDSWPKNALATIQLWRSEDGGQNWIPSGGATADGTGGDFWVTATFGQIPDEQGDPVSRISDGTWLMQGHVT